MSLLLCTKPCPYASISLSSTSLFLYSWHVFVDLLSIPTYLPPHIHSCFPPNLQPCIHTLVTYSCPFIGASFSIFIYIFRLISMYVCSNYPILATHNMYIPIMKFNCLPIPRRFARCVHTCDPMFKCLYFNIHTYYYSLSIHTLHVHIILFLFCLHLPSHLLVCDLQHRPYPYPLQPPSTYSYIYIYNKTVLNENKNNKCKQMNIKQNVRMYIYIYYNKNWRIENYKKK